MKAYAKMLLALLVLAAVLVNPVHAQSSLQPSTTGCGLLPSGLSSTLTVNAPWYCPINQQIYNQWSGDIPAAMVVVFISFMIAAAIFMVGVGLNSNRIRSYGIGEFYEAIVTAIIMVLFLYICAVMFGLLPSVLVGTINPYATAFNLMGTTITTAQGMYSAVFQVYLSISFATSPSIELSVGGALGGISKAILNFIGFAPQAFVNLWTIPATIYFLDPARAIGIFLVDGIMALYAEYYLLIFFSTAAIPAFLIPGVFFRAFPPTRALGGILIAFAFGFYLVAPSLFAVAYYFTAPTITRDMALSTFQIRNLGASASTQNAASPTSPLAVDLQSVKSSLDGFWLLIFFYPGLIAAITYSVIQEVANFIGRASYMGSAVRRFI